MNTDHAKTVIDRLSAFLTTPLAAIFETRQTADPRRHAFQLYRQTISQVPVYRRFLRDQSIDPNLIVSAADFAGLPLILLARINSQPNKDRAIAQAPHIPKANPPKPKNALKYALFDRPASGRVCSVSGIFI